MGSVTTQEAPETVHATVERLRLESQALRRRAAEALAAADQTLAQIKDGGSSQRIPELLAEVAGLRRALETRGVIEQAKGIIIGATGCDADHAFRMLVSQSQHQNRKLHDIAAELVASKVRRRD